jgi:RND family efflux transporter MFP subunit
MTEPPNNDELQIAAPVTKRRGFVAVLVRAVLPVGILAAGVVAYMILSVEPEKAKSPPAVPQAIRTKVKELRVRDYPVVIRTHGVVRPHSEVILTAQVPGRIIRIHPGFEDGAFFSEGDVLLELETVDYETAVVAAEAQVARTQAAHALEETRAKQARLNWEDLGYKEAPNELVLRLPQVREAKANVDSSLAQLEQSKRNLERTKIRAPFDGRVRRRTVGLGQSVGAGTPLGSVFAVDFAEVRLPIAGREIRFLNLPETAEDAPVEVELRSAVSDAEETAWKGIIIRTEGTLDENSLELFAIARVDDPFGLKSGKPPLRVGQPVTGSIAGKVLTNVVALPRVAVRQLDQVLLVDKTALTLMARTIVPIWSDEENIIVRDPSIQDGGWLSTTHLVYAPNGAKVEIIPDIQPTTPASGTNTTAQAKPVTKSGSNNQKP